MRRPFLLASAGSVLALALSACSFNTVKTVVEPGPVESWLTENPDATAIVWSEVYAGTEPSIALACPNDTPADIERALGRDWHEDYELALGDANQVVFSTVDGHTDVEVLPRGVVDLCAPADAARRFAPDAVTELTSGVGPDGEKLLQVLPSAG